MFFRILSRIHFSIPVADLSFLCKSLMCGIQESLLSIVTPKNLMDDTSGLGVSFILRISSSCWYSLFLECSSRFSSSSLVVLHLVVGLKCIKR